MHLINYCTIDKSFALSRWQIESLLYHYYVRASITHETQYNNTCVHAAKAFYRLSVVSVRCSLIVCRSGGLRAALIVFHCCWSWPNVFVAFEVQRRDFLLESKPESLRCSVLVTFLGQCLSVTGKNVSFILTYVYVDYCNFFRTIVKDKKMCC
jgi:hypothetical protein